jgi:hypothetical protein
LRPFQVALYSLSYAKTSTRRRAPRSQRGGQGFESLHLHHRKEEICKKISSYFFAIYIFDLKLSPDFMTMFHVLVSMRMEQAVLKNPPKESGIENWFLSVMI